MLRAGDLLVVNRTRVIPARLSLRKPTGGRVELLLVRPLGAGVRDATEWEGLGRPGRALKPGAELIAANGSRLTVTARQGELVRVRACAKLWDLMQEVGEVPLPPYIERPNGPRDADRDDYQTVFATEPGAVAAPTAALHFTERVLTALEQRGVRRAEILLHVGPGTFLPVRVEHRADVRQHEMHAERYEIPEATRRAVEATRAVAGRVVAVGTTSVRALETWRQTGDACGESSLFIVPGFEFEVVDAMVTNFHLSGSTLMMLVAAFAGRERILAAYEEAVKEGYRFFSYGDAMLLA